MSEKQPAIFFAGDKEKEKAIRLCGMIIDLIGAESEDILFKAYVLQMLLESFEETSGIDIRHGMSISESKEDLR